MLHPFRTVNGLLYVRKSAGQDREVHFVKPHLAFDHSLVSLLKEKQYTTC